MWRKLITYARRRTRNQQRWSMYIRLRSCWNSRSKIREMRKKERELKLMEYHLKRLIEMKSRRMNLRKILNGMNKNGRNGSSWNSGGSSVVS